MLTGFLEFGRWLREHKLRRKDSFRGRRAVYSHINSQVVANEAVDYLEFGVYKGNSIKAWLELNSNPHSRFFGFDSFEGLPEAWNHLTFSDSAGTFNVQGRTPDLKDGRVTFVKGWFQDTLPSFVWKFEPRNRLVVHLDADLHSSTLFVLTQLHRLMRPGTVLIFDDFSSTSTCVFRAFQDFLSAYPCKYRVVAHGGSFFDHVGVEITAPCPGVELTDIKLLGAGQEKVSALHYGVR